MLLLIKLNQVKPDMLFFIYKTPSHAWLAYSVLRDKTFFVLEGFYIFESQFTCLTVEILVI